MTGWAIWLCSLMVVSFGAPRPDPSVKLDVTTNDVCDACQLVLDTTFSYFRDRMHKQRDSGTVEFSRSELLDTICFDDQFIGQFREPLQHGCILLLQNHGEIIDPFLGQHSRIEMRDQSKILTFKKSFCVEHAHCSPDIFQERDRRRKGECAACTTALREVQRHVMWENKEDLSLFRVEKLLHRMCAGLRLNFRNANDISDICTLFREEGGRVASLVYKHNKEKRYDRLVPDICEEVLEIDGCTSFPATQHKEL